MFRSYSFIVANWIKMSPSSTSNKVIMLKLCENGSSIDYLYEKFSFEKSHGNRNFGFDLLASVRVFKTEAEPKFGFRTSIFTAVFI